MLKILASFIATAMLITPNLASACDETTQATIKSYECGDNCYLTITDKDGNETTGLCYADACSPWNDEASMPNALVGRTIEVVTGVRQQKDAEGNVMGDFPSFEKILFTTP